MVNHLSTLNHAELWRNKGPLNAKVYVQASCQSCLFHRINTVCFFLFIKFKYLKHKLLALYLSVDVKINLSRAKLDWFENMPI